MNVTISRDYSYSLIVSYDEEHWNTISSRNTDRSLEFEDPEAFERGAIETLVRLPLMLPRDASICMRQCPGSLLF